MKEGRIDRPGCVGVLQVPPLQNGRYLWNSPRWLELLTKLAAILDLGTQSQLTRTPPPGQVEPPFWLPRRPICPKSTWGVERTASTRWISISVARSRPGRPRWTQVAFLEHPPGGVHLAKKSYRTYPYKTYVKKPVKCRRCKAPKQAVSCEHRWIA